jgi:GT2 family glycosyltransferase
VGRRIDRWFLRGLVRKRYLLVNRRRAGVAIIDQAAAACLVLARSTVERIGGLFDERFPIFFNDVDLSRRVWNAGLEVHVLYDVKVVHHGGSSTRQMAPGRKKLEHVDGLLQYYDLHESRWKGRFVRRLVSRDRRRAARAEAVAGAEALRGEGRSE